MIQELLKQFGLTDKEVLVYLTVLEQGKITPSAVARITKINRTTVYSVAKELVQKGLVGEDLGGKTAYLIAKPASELETIVENKEKEIYKQKQIAKSLLGELEKIAGKAQYAIPKISFIEEKNLEDFLYKRSSTWNQSINEQDAIWWGFQDKTFVKYYEKWIDWYWEKARPEIKELRLLSNESAEAIKTKKFAKRQIKFWNKSEDFTATTWINGDFVIMIITSQKPYYLVEIHDAVLAHNMRELFKGIWNDI